MLPSLSHSLSLSLSFSPKDLLLQLDELLPLLICSLALSSMLLHPPTDNHIPHARYRYLLSQSHSLSHTQRPQFCYFRLFHVVTLLLVRLCSSELWFGHPISCTINTNFNLVSFTFSASLHFGYRQKHFCVINISFFFSDVPIDVLKNY